MTGLAFRPPVLLAGSHVRLLPLAREQIPELAEAGADDEIWRYLRIGPGRDVAEMTALVDQMLDDQRAGSVLPFAVERRSTGRLVGMLRFFHIDRANAQVEVGTWLHPSVWRTAVNTEAKLLALAYAFEGEGIHRAMLKTDLHNARSAAAIARIGGVREGTIREHIRRPDGQYSSSIVFSLLAPEWPAARDRLRARLDRGASPA
ncbi:MAG TPA: GNAT family protein [Thermoplasmata archaeon]|nr:GNAT family protein [Thermoplasmata archaeon]